MSPSGPTDLIPRLFERAIACLQSGRFDEAEELYRSILLSDPSHADALAHLGTIELQRGRLDNGLRLIAQSLEIDPRQPALLVNMGRALCELRRYEDALHCLHQAVALAPGFPEAFLNLGNVHRALKQYDDALSCFEKALTLQPDNPHTHNNRGNVLADLKRYEDALRSYDRAIALGPDYAEAYCNQGVALSELRRYDDAATVLAKAAALKPDIRHVRGHLLHARMQLCRWDDIGRQSGEVLARIDRGEPTATPYSLLAMPSSARQQRRCAELFCADEYSAATRHAFRRAAHKRDKIRLGYFSADFHNHPVAYLIARLFELHDRSGFDVTGFSLDAAPDDDMRRRLGKGLDRLIDVGGKNDRQVAELARQMEIDIAIDLMGYTQDCRPGIFAHGAAPIQVNYLGYPGTMAAGFIDYILADPIVIPPEHEPHYSEKIVRLPHSYQVNDATRPIADRHFTRSELGLPASGFVFCCFNNTFKITADAFDVWMRLLHKLDGSVLWLLQDNPSAVSNLQAEARKRQVEPERLIFAPRLPLADHLARHQCAGLFLDTFHYGAHTTASDALWGGLPLITKIGDTFASRVAASLLTAAGLPELITRSIEEYERLALELARDPQKLEAVRQKLLHNRLTCPLFDTARVARQIESGYRTMWQRHCADLAPAPFAIEDY